MVETGGEWTLEDAHRAKGYYVAREARLERLRQADQARLEAISQTNVQKKNLLISQIMAKAKSTRA